MRIGHQAGLHRSNGRLCGSYVYLLLCQVPNEVHIKAGTSVDPIKRLHSLIVACPLTPQLLAVAELPSRQIAYRAETALHQAFKPWHTHGEWFLFSLDHKAAFNAAWQMALSEFASPSWPIEWTKLSVRPLLAQWRSRGSFVGRLKAKRRTRSARSDFERDSR